MTLLVNLDPAPAGVCGITVTNVVCPACGQRVPVECRNIAEMTLDDIISMAQDGARESCPSVTGVPGHQQVGVSGPWPGPTAG